MPILGQLETMVRDLLSEIEFEEEDLQLLKLSEAGWRSIPFTRFIAADLDGKLIMSLYGAHCEIHIYEWSELYDQLKLRWHLRRRR